MKKGALIITSFLFAVLLVNFASAAVPLPAPNLPADYGPFGSSSTGLAQAVKGMIDGLGATINYALGGSGFGDISFAKFLLFILVCIVLYKPAEMIVGAGKKGLAITVSIMSLYLEYTLFRILL